MINYTDLSVMKSSEVSKLAETSQMYKEEPVEENDFETKKQYLYKGYEVPKDVQMLKFRYYTPENTLIEQNNVPYVYDGTSITDVINYYYLSESNTKPTFTYSTWETDGWSKTAETVTADKRYLYCVTETRFSNTAEGQCGNLTDVTLISVYGEQGERGAMYLGHYVDNQACYDDNKPAVFTGDYYLNTTDGYIHVYDKDSDLWATLTSYDDYRYSIAMNDIIGAVNSTQLETFVTAKTGWFENLAVGIIQSQKLFSKEITLVPTTDSEGNVTGGGIIQSKNYSETDQTGWQIDYDGNATFNNATVRGKVYATEGEFSGAISAATITGGTISGTEISGGSITGISISGSTITGTSINGDDINIGENGSVNGYVGNSYIKEKLIAGVYFFDRDIGDGSASSNVTAGILAKSNNVKTVKKCGKGKYIVIIKDLSTVYNQENKIYTTPWGSFNYGDTNNTAYYIVPIFVGDKKDTTTSGSYTAWKIHTLYNSIVRPVTISEVDSTGNNFTINNDDINLVETSGSSNIIVNYPQWSWGSNIVKFTQDGTDYWALGLVVTDNQNDDYINVFGGCKILIKAVTFKS